MPPQYAAKPTSGPFFKTAAAFCAELAPISYAIEPMIRKATLYTATAKTGSGKTAFAVVATLAVATGRSDILGLEVEQGRVVYCSFENPDDVRMRLLVAAHIYGIDLNELGDEIIVRDARLPPEILIEQLAADAEMRGPFTFVVIDTFAAAFDCKDINSNVDAGEFTRRLRPLTRLPGAPAVIVLAHPVKNASADNLVPYGGGAILNEVDGNLTLSKNSETGIVTFHWQGKLRGIDFQPRPFHLLIKSCPAIVDNHGKEVLLPVLMPAIKSSQTDREGEEARCDRLLLAAIEAEPNVTQKRLGHLTLLEDDMNEKKN